MRTRIKICGITREQDALDAVRLGADAIGLVFYPPSPRAVSVEQAIEIVGCLPPFVSVVGLFVDADREEISRTLEQVRIDVVQFHGNESPADCAGHRRPWIKAVRMRPDTDVEAVQKRYSDAGALLLDTYQAGTPGGTGQAFDWDLIPKDLSGSIVLAGGLTPDNVEEAVRRVRPYAVDVSGGVEAEKGIKDAERIAAFIRGVQRAND